MTSHGVKGGERRGWTILRLSLRCTLALLLSCGSTSLAAGGWQPLYYTTAAPGGHQLDAVSPLFGVASPVVAGFTISATFARDSV